MLEVQKRWIGTAALLALAMAASGCERTATDVRRDTYGGAALSAAVMMDTGGVGGPGPVFHFQGSGDYADVWFSGYDGGDSTGGGGGFAYGYLSVFQGTSGDAELYYDAVRCDLYYNCSYESGYGAIQSGDFQGSARTGFHLETNTSYEVNPAFFRWAGNGGPIVLDWRPNGFSFTHTQSSSQSQYGDIRVRSTGAQTYGSAWVNGSLIGAPVSKAWGSGGSFQNASVEIRLVNAVAAASGAGQLTIGGELRTFSFTGIRLADGRVSGEWERFNRASGVRDHGKVTCLSILGNEAWIGGTQTGGDVSGEVGWRVRDGGRAGAGVRDLISLQFVAGSPGFAQSYCSNTPTDPALLDIESGNITVRQ